VTSDYVFVGNRNEIVSQNINLSYDPVTGANRNFNVVSTRPFPQWGTVSMQFSEGWANTHSLQASFTKRYSAHWQASGTYTLSALYDGIPQPHSGFEPVPFALAEDVGESYGLAVSDQRHRAVFNGIWDAGFGFQLSGLYFFGSGQRYATTWGGDLRNTGGGSGRLRPDGTIVPRNDFVGRPIHRVDLRVQRRFGLPAGVRFDAIVEAFNLFNHANHGAYSTQESVPQTYGRPVQNTNQAYLPRVLQLGFRMTF
jgi:hypothetical protein